MQNELGQSLAMRPELDGIEVSACFFEDEDGLHIHSFYISTMRKITPVAFTIRDGRLYTPRERELPAFNPYCMRARNLTIVDGNAKELLLNL